MFFRLSTQTGGRVSFDFWETLITAIHGRRGDLVGPSHPTSVTNENPQDQTDSYDGAMAICIDAAVRQCPFDVAWMISPRNRWDCTFDTNVWRILRLMDLCITIGNMNTCAQQLSRLTTRTDDLARQFQVLYFPFLARLRPVLDKHHIEFCSPPFRDFAESLIGRYLIGVLHRGRGT